MFERLFRMIDFRLRKLFFPSRKTHLAGQSDTNLRYTVIGHIPSTERADAELELETRAWFREFWSRSVVAWLALLVSGIALAVSICAFYSAHHLDPSSPNGKDNAAQQQGGNLQHKTPNAN